MRSNQADRHLAALKRRIGISQATTGDGLTSDCCRCSAHVFLPWLALEGFEVASKVLLCRACEDDDHSPCMRSEHAIYVQFAELRSRMIANSGDAGNAQLGRRLNRARQIADSALVAAGFPPSDPGSDAQAVRS